MAVRLNKALKELNVGINTVAEFLQKKGVALQDATPNAKITDEQYDLLIKEFGDDMKKNAVIKQQIQNQKERELQEKKERQQALREKERQEKEAAAARKPQVKIVGNIKDLQRTPSKTEKTLPHNGEGDPAAKPSTTNTPNALPIEGEMSEGQSGAGEKPVERLQVVETPVSEPVHEEAPTAAPAEAVPVPAAVTKEAEPSVKKKKLSPAERLEQDENGVYHLAAPAEAGVQFKQVGFIDLSSLNSKTRPDRKSKAERRKEQKQKQQANAAGSSGLQGQNAQQGQGNGPKKKRNRINNNKIDIDAAAKQNNGQNQQGKKQQGGKPNNQQALQNQQKNQQAQQATSKKKKKQKLPPKPQELSEEEVAKQVKETLARLTAKQEKRGVKYRKDKRQAIHERMAEEEAAENAESKVLKLTEFVTANELATMMDVPVTKVIGTCMSIGMMVSINQRLDAETINIVAEEFGYTTTYVSEEVSHAIEEVEDKAEDLVRRAPIITVMGHVDHGKTSLLDYIRKTNVIAGEAGGITQHIGAYNVKMKDGRHITFLDTPGHEAFTAMRARGAKVTDIAIIIVAADDDVMPQTKEAIAHAQAAGVPMVFAINKIDKPGANPEKIKEQLAAMNLLVEEWGGKYQSQDISAKKGIGVEELMDKVLLEAELLDLKANPDRKATGSIIESTLDKGRGYVATVLVSNGTLHQGDIVLAGTHYGRIKAMFNERGQRIEKALPAEPAVILGLNGAPTAGDSFHVMETEQEAREICNKREQLKREQGLRTQTRLTLDELGRRIALGDFKELNLIVKGDVDGSIEALSDSLIKLSTEKIQVNVIHKAVGQISENDVELAHASENVIIIGFQVRPSAAARRLAEQYGVDIRLYSIIYDAIEEVKDAMEGMLAPTLKEEVTAQVDVRQVYHITKVGTVAGCWVTEGKVHRSDKIRVVRDGIVIHSGEILALKRFKDDVKEVGRDFECGISIVNFNDIREGDVLETYTEVEVKAKL
ncbi:MAG: translation initiation factor IF-2 [Bacteroidaceae bacterium]|nr:translation initiation factor IF-2 [Bacteroidaceae bacterium]